MTSGAVNATPSDDRGGRPFGPGRHWAFVAAAVVAVVAAVGVVVALAAGDGVKPVDHSFGHLPSWLPKSAQLEAAIPRKAAAAPSTAAAKLEQATAAHPVLSEEQGYTVHAALPGGSADITAVGPSIPGYVTTYAGKGLWPAGKPVPSTFFVTLTDVKGTIPVAAADFSVENQAYETIKATVTLNDGKPAPATVHSGESVTLAIHSTTLEGQGAVAWAPTGRKALVAWVYQVELD